MALGVQLFLLLLLLMILPWRLVDDDAVVRSVQRSPFVLSSS